VTLADEVLTGLAAAVGGAPAISGFLTDEIGDPIVGATVRAVADGPFAGHELARATTDTAGRFELRGAFPAEFVVVAEAGGVDVRVPAASSSGDLGELRIVRPVRLTGSVGDGGDNRPRDVRRVQDRLHRLGRLSDDDVEAEPVDLAAAPPVAPGWRTMAALASHLAARLGRPPPVIRVDPGTPIARALAEDPPFPPSRLAVDAPVGSLPGGDAAATMNRPPSFALVQDRLRQLGLLRPGDHAAEAVDVAAAGPIDPATRPRTLEAIAVLDRSMGGGSLQAIVPGAWNDQLLRDPRCYGRRPLAPSDSVGEGGRNLPEDVRAIQDRLVLLGHLSATDRDAERPASGTAPARVPDSALARTIAAIRDLRDARAAEPAPAAGLVDPVDSSLRRLARPPRLVLGGTVGWGPAVTAANRPSDVRAVQDRLLLLGLLPQAEYDTERADPDAPGSIAQAQVPRTALWLGMLARLRGPFTLMASVGRAAVNAAADVQAIQDRLLGLNYLNQVDHARERADPAAGAFADPAKLTATFQALENLRARVFELPAADATAPWTAQAYLEPGDDTHRLLQDPLFFGRDPLRLAGSVGTDGWNFPADVRAVQDRLLAMRLLSVADHAQERADPLERSRSRNLALSATREAIRQLRGSLLGEAEPLVERVELRSPALAALDDRLGALRVPLELTGSVGWGGANAPTDVLHLLDRLHGLGFLDDVDYDAEAQGVRSALAAGGPSVPDAQISEGIAAIATWQQIMLGTAVAPVCAPWSETVRTLAAPSTPRRVRLTLQAGVGRAGTNLPGDVRAVQDRLFELGILEPGEYFQERVDPAGAGPVPEAALGATIAAIERLQQTLAGLASTSPDSLVSAGGRSARVLEDPTFSTPTAPNPACAVSSAGPEHPAFVGALSRIGRAIEAVEGGVSQGEIPAILRNASGTPASWGVAQVIGGTETTALRAHDAFAAFYGLDPARLAVLAQRATDMAHRFDAICNAVPAGTGEARLQTLISNYVASDGAALRAETGLGPDDIARMFRAGQLRRHLLALGPGGNEAVLFDAATHPDAAANLAVLQLSISEVGAYLRHDYHGEHRAGFVTRALFHAPEGQTLRNALTDDTGRKIGRLVVEMNWNATGGLGLNDRQRAQLTAYLHNHGGDPAALAANWVTVDGDDYVQRVIAVYDVNP
jgi:hypothetical protein